MDSSVWSKQDDIFTLCLPSEYLISFYVHAETATLRKQLARHRNRSQACAWRTQGAEYSEYYSLSPRALIQNITKATWVGGGGSLRSGVTWLNLNRVMWGKKPSNSRNGNGNCNHLLSCHAYEKTEQPEQIPKWLVNEISANPYTVFVLSTMFGSISFEEE